jgi:two-component system CitB family response regulator
VIKVLVVDDDFRVAQLHAAMVERTPGFEVVGLAHTAAEALAMAASASPDLVLLDEYLPDERGSSVLRRLNAATIVITAANDGPTIRHAIGAGALNVIVKPFNTPVLTARLEAFARFWSTLGGAGALDQPAVDRALALLRDGDSPAAPMPKGRSSVTTDAVVDALRAASEPLTAIEVAEATGISRATAQRYLSDLARAGRVELSLRYGSTGRPEHRYGWRA